MSFRLKFKPNIGASKERRGSGAAPSTVATPERGNTSCTTTVSESLTKESCRLIISSAETLNPGMLPCGDDCMDPSVGEMVGSLVTISNGESDLENIMAKRAAEVSDCLSDGVSLDDTYHLGAEEGPVSLEDDTIGLGGAMPMPLDDAIPLDDNDVIPLDAVALLNSPRDIAEVGTVSEQRPPSPTASSCTASSCVTPVEGNSPRPPDKGESEEQSSEKLTGKKRTRKSNGTSSAKRKKKDDDTSSVAGGSKKPKIREAPNRSTMTMQELIYYNPTANPMSGTGEEKQEQEDEMVTPLEPPAGLDKGKSTKEEEDHEDENDQGRLVPKLKIGADGNIVIDEASMYVESSQKAVNMFDRELVREYAGSATASSFRKTYKITKWTKDETNQFFRALSQVGTDFTIMTLLLPKRTRKELKNKFKKEEKLRPHLVSDALKNQNSH